MRDSSKRSASDTVRSSQASETATNCPFHSVSPEVFDEWLELGLHCSAGKREFALGRYFVTRFRNGSDFSEALEQFRREVADYRKTGFLGLYVHDESQAPSVEDELRLLGEVMREAGLAENAASVITGDTVAIPIEVVCPVIGQPTTYEFFSVAFCRHAADPSDKLYDPSLSTPFTAINTTSNAFTFAMLVRDQCIRSWGRAPHEVISRDDVELLFRKCVTVWQNMSINSITSHSRIALEPSRGVYLSEDRKRWIAPHNNPVFADQEKCPHFHEMPITYATRLCKKWMAALFDGKTSVPTRDGQAGGIPSHPVEGTPAELYEGWIDPEAVNRIGDESHGSKIGQPEFLRRILLSGAEWAAKLVELR
jgi:hypothetical protein